MAKNKTTHTDENVFDFIDRFAPNEQRKSDSLKLIELMGKVTGEKARMYGPSIVGFGNYHYKYASGHEGDAPLLGFSPRKGAISLYVHSGLPEHEHLLEGLGKCKISKGCIYVNKLADINIPVLNNLMKESVKYLKKKYK